MKARHLSLIALVAVMIFSAVPASAIMCTSCGADGICFSDPGSGNRCRQSIDFCTDNAAICTLAVPDLASEWTVASVEVKQTAPNGQKVATTIQTPSTARAALKK